MNNKTYISGSLSIPKQELEDVFLGYKLPKNYGGCVGLADRFIVYLYNKYGKEKLDKDFINYLLENKFLERDNL